MTDEQLKVMKGLVDEGYAVIVWSPDELGDDISPVYVEQRSIAFGFDVLGIRKKQDEPKA